MQSRSTCVRVPYTHTRRHTGRHTRTQAHTHTRRHTHTHTHASTRTHARAGTHREARTHARTHTHTHTHTLNKAILRMMLLFWRFSHFYRLRTVMLSTETFALMPSFILCSPKGSFNISFTSFTIKKVCIDIEHLSQAWWHHKSLIEKLFQVSSYHEHTQT